MAMAIPELSYEKVPCALCGGDDHRLLWRIAMTDRHAIYIHGARQVVTAPGQIVRCNSCGLVFVNPRMAPRAEASSYSDREEDLYFAATRAARTAGNEGLLADLKRLLGRPGRLLDVGCGDGLLLAQARAGGWQVAGVEIRARLVQRLRREEPDVPVHHGQVQDASFPDASFDVVTLINVLEHVHYPLAMVAECGRIVRPGGIVAVHVPNAGGLQARLFGAGWRHLETLEHLYYFDRRTLGKLLWRCNLEVIASFVLYGSSPMRNRLLTIERTAGLFWGNSLGLLARRIGAI
jgi:2-polyprenyl-3-methyl-5-hydroxy-6-metoxy-1,4-benzoquinol methylase